MRRGFGAVPRGVWVLGLGSMFMDMSSELVHSLLPIFMTTVLGVGMVTIGLLEGIAEATASITKVFSGVISDWIGKRKFIVVLGYGLSAITKPLFPLANSVGLVFAARFIDRIGKGIRGAPRDALVADITPPESRGAAFGLRQALDSVGAFMGPLLALIFMAVMADNIKAVLWIAVIPALITVVLLAVGIREPDAPPRDKRARLPLTASEIRRLGHGYWLVVILGAVFTLARFSEAFLVLRAQNVGLPIGLVPLVMIIMNVVYAGMAWPAGIAADRISRKTLLLGGLGMLVIADVVLAFASVPWHAFAGVIFWGLHMALTQGLLSKLVADTVPNDLRGTAFGMFNMVSGVAMLLASVIAGVLWAELGPSATFLAGSAFAAITAVGILLHRGGKTAEDGRGLKPGARGHPPSLDTATADREVRGQ